MPRKIVESKPLTLPQVKTLMKGLDRELSQFQRKTLEYVTSFSKLSAKNSEKLVEKLMKSFGIDISEAVQIVNCMPETTEELRVFMPRHRVFEAEKLKQMLGLLDEYRK